MKKLIFPIVKAFSVYAILGVSSLSAQANHVIVANIPFGFTVTNQNLSAGTYTFSSDMLQSPIVLRGEQGKTAMFVPTFSAQSNKVQENAKLVFRHYGTRYFLSKIWYSGSNQGRELTVSKLEKEYARNLPKPEETVLLIATSKRHKPPR
jgi:hypothetical protein